MNGTSPNEFTPKGLYTREQSIVTILRLYDWVSNPDIISDPDKEDVPRGNTFANIAVGGYATIQGDWIYYQNSINGLYAVKIDGSGKQKIINDIPLFINVIDNTIYYSNLNDGSKLYSVRTDGSSNQKLSDFNVDFGVFYYYYYVDGDIIYYQNMNDDLKLYTMRTDGSNKKLHNNDSMGFDIVGNQIYYNNWRDGLYKMNIDGSGKQKLSDDDACYIHVIGDRIYYRIASGSCELYTIKTDGSDRQKIYERYSQDVQVVGDRFYFVNDNGDACTMKLDGSDERIVD